MLWFVRFRGVLALAVLALAFTFVAVDFAEARRGGGFGSRGMRTFDRPAPTRTAPDQGQPINRSMTPRQQQTAPGQQGQAARSGAQQQQRGGMFGGLAGGLLGGLMLGGLIGMLMGGGLGGMAGFFGLILQVLIIGGIIYLVMRFLRGRRQQPAMAGGPSPYAAPDTEPTGPQRSGLGGLGGLGGNMGGGLGGQTQTEADAPASTGGDEIGITADDYDAFEQLLVEIQAAFAREDYAALRERTTPEIMSYLAEELSENAVNGRKNDVTDVALLQGDLAEAWQEGDQEFATVAMRYESVDVMRDRTTGEIVDGSETPTETTEIWTFVRPVGGGWMLSAIQDA